MSDMLILVLFIPTVSMIFSAIVVLILIWIIRTMVLCLAFPRVLISSKHKYNVEYEKKKDDLQQVDGHNWIFITPSGDGIEEKSIKTLFYFHGNRSTIKSIRPLWVDISTKLEINVVLIEYPYYLEKSYFRIVNENDIKNHVFETVSKVLYKYKKSISHDNIYLMGKSVGTGVAIWIYYQLLSRGLNSKKVILHSAYKSLIKTKWEYLNWLNVIMRQCDGFDTESLLIESTFESSLAFILVENDEVIPNQHTTDLSKLVKQSKIYSLVGTHAKYDQLEYSKIMRAILGSE